MPETLTLMPGTLMLSDIERLRSGGLAMAVDERAWAEVERSARLVLDVAAGDARVYGINTGFGSLARTAISRDRINDLQRRIVLSHAAGTGAPLSDPIVRLVLALKINALALGLSGCQRTTIEALVRLYNHDALPVIPAKGSVGASGDLAPLAHLSAVLMGYGEVRMDGETVPASTALRRVGLEPVAFAAKEGLALLNGTQVSTALALDGLIRARRNFATAVVAGALSVDASLGADTPFDPRISEARGQVGQTRVAAVYHNLLRGSEIRKSHEDCDRVQDPLFAEMSASGHGRLSRSSAIGRRCAAARGQRGDRQSAGVLRRG